MIRNLSKTPLFNLQQVLKPVLNNFAGYEMPMKFGCNNTGDVVRGVRQDKIGIFDVSHMGFINLKSDKLSNITKLLEKLYPINTNIISNNQSKISLIFNRQGYVIDDLIISNINDYKYRLVVNANTKHDILQLLNWCNTLNNTNVNISLEDKVILAIQGKQSQGLMEDLFNYSFKEVYFNDNVKINNMEVTRTGYTGVDGFELYCNIDEGKELYQEIINSSRKDDSNIMFGGLIERDILRLEAGLCLSGNEFGKDMNVRFPDLDLNFVIGKRRRQEGDFIGSDYINKTKNIVRVGFLSKKPARIGDVIYSDQCEILGKITSATKSYNLNKFISMGYIKRKATEKEYNLRIIDSNNRKRVVDLELTNLPFIPHNFYRK